MLINCCGTLSTYVDKYRTVGNLKTRGALMSATQQGCPIDVQSKASSTWIKNGTRGDPG